MSIPTPDRPKLNHWLHEPLLHFLLIGVVLFGAYTWRNHDALAPADSQRIVLTEDDIQQLLVSWRAQGRPEPSVAQLQSLIDVRVREEVLYREALAMGLDAGDTIVRRRMAQKMDFLAEDLSALREPSRDELHAWFMTNSQQFASSPRASFCHRYFSFDQHGDKTRAIAADALAKIVAHPADATEVEGLGDPFMFQDTYTERTPDQVGNEFGGKFARSLFELRPNAWSGPIESGFGWHLVFVDALDPGRVPEFEEVEAQVKAAWLAQKRAEFKLQAYTAMRSKYQVVLPTTSTNTTDRFVTNQGQRDAK